MDLYVSWNIPKDALTLDAIRNKFEEFSKPQTNEVRAHFDLLTSFCQGTRNVDEWYNAIQAQVNLAKYPPETAKILHRDIFCLFMRDEDFITKTVNEGNVDIQKFPASKVCQLAKKMESSKAMAKHIRQVAGDIPAAQVQLMHHQCTQLPTGNFSRRKSNSTSGQKPQNHKMPDVPTMWKTPNMLRLEAHSKSATGAVTHHMQKASNVKLESSSVKYAINLATSHQYASKKAKANTPLIPFMQGN